MPSGLIKDTDVAHVRDSIDIVALIGSYVTLKRSGTSYKGLCPFHDEKSGSFYVTPGRGYHCFGCSESGDAITFIQKIDHLSFRDAVERLADDLHYTLTYDHADAPQPPAGPPRKRLIEAHEAAVAFYQQQLLTDDAATGRAFLTERGFGRSAAEQFNVGYAPNSWDALTTHLRTLGFTDEELTVSGLASASKRGTPVDRFRGRLMWPIRNITGQTVGFGARKLYDNDDGPKYLNTPETPIFKKSQLLYGLNHARKTIADTSTAVVVEGYTDVMACHLAGITTAVATCGTAFGADHARALHRLLGDGPRLHGQVVFTFDGDAAGQKAAVRAFDFDAAFQAATYVAVEPNGMDPCELRQAAGDNGVRNLINARVPLVEFVLRTVIARSDITTPEGRALAVGDAAPVLARVSDVVLRGDYTRRLAGWLGLPSDDPINIAVRRAASDAAATPSTRATTPDTPQTDPDTAQQTVADIHAAEYAHERDALRSLVQHPADAATAIKELTADAFTNPTYRAAWTHFSTLVRGGGITTTEQLLSAAPSDILDVLRDLAVDLKPFPANGDTRRAVNRDVYNLVLHWANRDQNRLGELLIRAEADGNGLQVATEIDAELAPVRQRRITAITELRRLTAAA